MNLSQNQPTWRLQTQLSPVPSFLPRLLPLCGSVSPEHRCLPVHQHWGDEATALLLNQGSLITGADLLVNRSREMLMCCQCFPSEPQQSPKCQRELVRWDHRVVVPPELQRSPHGDCKQTWWRKRQHHAGQSQI